LSINNLAGYKPVTPQLHGYTVVHQQLSATDRFFAVFSRIEAGPGIQAKRAAWRALSPSARVTLRWKSCGESAQQIPPAWLIDAGPGDRHL